MQAKRLLFDGISWMVMGARKEEARHLLGVRTSDAAEGVCTIVGPGGRANLLDALFVKIRCVHDGTLKFNPSGFASHFRPTVLTVTTKQGRRYSRSTMVPRGSPINPLTERELLAKFQACGAEPVRIAERTSRGIS